MYEPRSCGFIQGNFHVAKTEINGRVTTGFIANNRSVGLEGAGWSQLQCLSSSLLFVIVVHRRPSSLWVVVCSLAPEVLAVEPEDGVVVVAAATAAIGQGVW
eukprot:gene5364-7114_t